MTPAVDQIDEKKTVNKDHPSWLKMMRWKHYIWHQWMKYHDKYEVECQWPAAKGQGTERQLSKNTKKKIVQLTLIQNTPRFPLWTKNDFKSDVFMKNLEWQLRCKFLIQERNGDRQFYKRRSVVNVMNSSMLAAQQIDRKRAVYRSSYRQRSKKKRHFSNRQTVE